MINRIWFDTKKLISKSYTCGYCGNNIASNIGYYKKDFNGMNSIETIYICHHCNSPTYFKIDGEQIPGLEYGYSVNHLPEDVERVYNEARKCFSVEAYTSSVLCCRKLLMNIACEEGAPEGKTFVEYINYLNSKNYIPPNGRTLLEKVRTLGNQATHRLEQKTQEDAELAIKFTGMILRFIYEMPNEI